MKAEMGNYVLTIRVPFITYDDIEARKIAQKKLKELNVEMNSNTKLQEVIINKPPRKIALKLT